MEMSDYHLVGEGRVAAIHGRFQPFHNGHLEYALRAYSLCDLLYIGITNSDPFHVAADGTAPHRHLLDANPYPFYLRAEIIIGAMQEAGAQLDHFRVIPFPINRAELIRYYVPPEAVHYLCVFDQWGERKVELLTNQGLKTVGWKDMPKLTAGTNIRQELAKGKSIAGNVPPFVEHYLNALKVRQT